MTSIKKYLTKKQLIAALQKAESYYSYLELTLPHKQTKKLWKNKNLTKHIEKIIKLIRAI